MIIGHKMDVIKAFYACRFFHEKNNSSKTSKLPIFLFYLWHIVPFFLLLLPLNNEAVGAVGKATAKKTSLFTLIIFVLFCSYLIITGINDLSLKPKHYLNCWTSLWALFKVVSIRFTASLIQKLFIQRQNKTIVRQGRRRTERDEAKFILKNIKKLTKIKYFYSLVYFF